MQMQLYLDEDTSPFKVVKNGEEFDFDTTGLADGVHKLRIVTVEAEKVTGQRIMTFTVRNGPGIAVVGLGPGDEVRGTLKLLVNASEAGIEGKFDPLAMETHRGIPLFFGFFAALVVLACAAFLVTDPLRHRSYIEQAQKVADLTGDELDSTPAIPLNSGLSEGSDSGVRRSPHPQHLVLAEGDFLEIISIGNTEADLIRGAELFAAKCSGCHGSQGQGTVQEKVTLGEQGVYPRLAGQNRRYIYRQLISFDEGWRDNAQMLSMAKSLSQQDRIDIASYIERLSPPYPLRREATEDLLDRGKEIAERGIQDIGVARCSGCHGADGRGAGPNFPYLAGQWTDYLASQLRNWQDQVRQNSWRGLMRPVARGLSDGEINAVAAYFSHLPNLQTDANLD